jgi:hypothetical protein
LQVSRLYQGLAKLWLKFLEQLRISRTNSKPRAIVYFPWPIHILVKSLHNVP